MTVTGVIAEYNPFHNGHAYQILQARKQTGADYIVVVMSGDYVQRGTPAILEKHLRARMALEHGADLVLELPVRYSTASARDFATGAVGILDALGVADTLCFGSESGDTKLLTQFARILLEEPSVYSNALQTALKSGASYPLAHQQGMVAAWRTMFPDTCSEITDPKTFFSGPNNLLGMEYIRAILALNSSIKPFSICRTSDNYHSSRLEERFCSATAVRQALLENRVSELIPYIPESVLSMLSAFGADDGLQTNTRFLTEDDFSLLLKYRLLSLSAQELSAYLDYPESLANRTIRQLRNFESFSQFADLLKTKEITRARINRALLHVILNLQKNADAPHFIRVLGFRKEAAPLLSAIKKNSHLPLAVKMADIPSENWQTDLFASNLYHSVQAAKTRTSAVDERSIPIIISENGDTVIQTRGIL